MRLATLAVMALMTWGCPSKGEQKDYQAVRGESPSALSAAERRSVLHRMVEEADALNLEEAEAVSAVDRSDLDFLWTQTGAETPTRRNALDLLGMHGLHAQVDESDQVVALAESLNEYDVAFALALSAGRSDTALSQMALNALMRCAQPKAQRAIRPVAAGQTLYNRSISCVQALAASRATAAVAFIEDLAAKDQTVALGTKGRSCRFRASALSNVAFLKRLKTVGGSTAFAKRDGMTQDQRAADYYDAALKLGFVAADLDQE